MTDHLDSIDTVLDSEGNVVERQDYFSFGAERVTDAKEEAPVTDLGYTGKEKDEETGLNYYEARYYDSELVRFISVDPWEGELSDPQTVNKYSYVLNNPIKYNDPSGENPVLVAYGLYVLGGAVAGALASGAIDAGIQYFTSGQIDWSQTLNAVQVGAVQGALTGPAGALANIVKSFTLRGGIIFASDVAGGTIAEIVINHKSFKEAAFQSTFASLAGYGAGKMLGKLNAKYGIGSQQAAKLTEHLYKSMRGDKFTINSNEADRLWKAFLGDDYVKMVKRDTGEFVGYRSSDNTRFARLSHTDVGTPEPHMNLEVKNEKGKVLSNSHVIIKD